jgi:hypothetical protein
MKYYYDCEFEENGTCIIPISIGFVSEDNRELYLVNKGYIESYKNLESYEWRGQQSTVFPWLCENVIDPIIHSDTELTPYEQWGEKVWAFISDNGKYLERDQIELWGWYAAYDHVMLAQIYGPMIQLPKPIPMFTKEIENDRRGQRKIWRDSEKYPLHNALADAKYQKYMHGDWLSEWEVGLAEDGHRFIYQKEFDDDGQWIDTGRIVDRD